MIDLPASWQEQLQTIDWSKLEEKVQDYGPVIQIIQHTWNRESLQEISQGKLFVPDEVVNEAIAQRIPANGRVTAVKVVSHANGRMDIVTDTTSVGKIELSGEIKEFVHSGDKSYAVYQVRERNIPSHGLMSWVFSRISLSMAERLVGKIEISDDMPVNIHRNTINIDYSKVLAASDFGKAEFQGYRLLDLVEVEGAVPKEGGIEFQTKLNVPDSVKNVLMQLVADETED